jgi:hypothetical protein
VTTVSGLYMCGYLTGLLVADGYSILLKQFNAYEHALRVSSSMVSSCRSDLALYGRSNV